MELIATRPLIAGDLGDVVLRASHEAWQVSRAGRELPAFSGFNLLHLPMSALSCSVLVDVDGGAFTYGFCGPEMTRLSGIDPRGCRIDSWSGSLTSHLQRAYGDVVATRSPLAEVVITRFGDTDVHKTVLRLPFAEHGGQVDSILIVATHQRSSARAA